MFEVRQNKELFAKHGIKNTRQRNVIFEILKESDEPMTAEQVYLKIKDNSDSISLSTIYRILELFISRELVQKSSVTGDSRAMYELNLMKHKHHLICVGCRRRVSLEGCPLEEYENLLRGKNGFDITGHKLEIYGFCPECKDIRK